MEAAGVILGILPLLYYAISTPFRRLLFYTKLYGAQPQTAALDYKSARHKESDTVAIAAHWTAQGFLIFSLVASIISVYFASAQQKTLSRLLNPEDIRFWIRRKEPDLDSNPVDLNFRIPSAAAVLTVSAPNALLSLAVHSFLIGFGIYLGCVWINELEESSTKSGKRAIFITYITTASICYSLYSLSNIAASGKVDERLVLLKLYGIARPDNTSNSAPSNSMNASGTPPRSLNHSSEIQQIIRESAQMKRDLATLDDRIATLLGDSGQANDLQRDPPRNSI
ncbi:hypothetical protein N7528_003638 [Penicillium herquei]|nr:hypothetical protein N7528_003638 [Penicillium herquei]